MSNKGLGDTVSAFIKKATGGRVKECGGCSARRAWLNRKVPYDTKEVLQSLHKLNIYRKGKG